MHFESPERRAGWILFLIFLMLMIAVGILSNHFKRVYAQDTTHQIFDDIVENESSQDPLLFLDRQSEIANNLTPLIINEMIMCRQKHDGTILFHKHCRESSVNCEQTAKEYANYMAKYSEEFGLDPYLLTAVAVHESNLDAYRVGKKGERGIFQLLPWSPWGKASKFVTNKGHRKQCKQQVGHCQEEVVGLAARLLKNSLDDCKTVEGALTKYNTGECLPLNDKYTYSVLSIQKSLKTNENDIMWCTGEEFNDK